MYVVEGGIFTGTDFLDLEPDSFEQYGPFESYDEAFTAWKRGMFSQKLDICTHRLFIIEE